MIKHLYLHLVLVKHTIKKNESYLRVLSGQEFESRIDVTKKLQISKITRLVKIKLRDYPNFFNKT